MLLTHVIDLAVERRHMVTTLQGDPVVIRLLAQHEPFRLLMERLYAVMVGDDADPAGAGPAAMMTAAIGGTVSHPLVMELDDDTLRTNLLKLAPADVRPGLNNDRRGVCEDPAHIRRGRGGHGIHINRLESTPLRQSGAEREVRRDPTRRDRRRGR